MISRLVRVDDTDLTNVIYKQVIHLIKLDVQRFWSEVSSDLTFWNWVNPPPPIPL